MGSPLSKVENPLLLIHRCRLSVCFAVKGDKVTYEATYQSTLWQILTIRIKGLFKITQEAEYLLLWWDAPRMQRERPAARISQPNLLWRGRGSALCGNLCFIRGIENLPGYSDRTITLYLPSSQFLAEKAWLLCTFCALFFCKSLAVVLRAHQLKETGVAASSKCDEVNDEVILA